MNVRSAAALVLLGSATPSLAQTPVFRHLDSRQGLSDNSAFHVLQDHQGFLWIGTNDGLNRYDGTRFTTFRHDPRDSSSISNNTVRRIWEDRRRELWIRTESGLDRLDRGTGRFRHYRVPVALLLEEEDGAILVAGSHGIYRHEAVADSFQRVVAFPLLASSASPSAADPVWGFFKDRRGTVWVSTQEGRIFGIEPNGAVSQVQTPWRFTMLHLEDEAGHLWIGHHQGIGAFDPVTRRFSGVPGTGAIRGRVLSAYQDRRGALWLGGDELHRLDPGGTTARAVPLDAGSAVPLSTPIWSIMEDREGALWLSTPRGLRISDPYAKPFRSYRHDSRDPKSLSADPVMALTVDRTGAWWAGTLSGLNRIDPRTSDARRFAHRPGHPDTLCGDQVWSLIATPDGRVWVGTDQGLCVFDPSTERFSRRRLPGGIGGLQPLVFALVRDRQSAVWAGTTMGLFRIDPSTGVTRRIDRVHEDRPGMVRIEGLALDASGTVWAGTSWSDLYRIIPGTDRITHYPLGDSGALRGSEGFWDIEPRPDGRLWLASDRGFFVFDPGSGTIRMVGPAEGAPPGPVYAIVTDTAGALWLSTGNGLLRYARPLESAERLGEVRHYSTADGLAFPEFNRRAGLVAPDGHLVFGGMGGIIRFDPASIRDNPHPPPVVLTGIERSRRGGLITLSAYHTDSITAAWDDTGLALEFAALSFSSASNARFAYRLEGVDPEWVTGGGEWRARYPALEPGRYTFRVRAANADGVWDQSGTSLAILVSPPWWATWWFRGIVSLLGFGLLAGSVRHAATRKLRLRVRELELEQQVQRERNRISRDLHDNVGSQVSTILAGIELVQLSTAAEGAPPGVDGYLTALRQDAERTMSELRETVWSLHQDRVTLAALVERIHEYLGARRRYLERPVLTSHAAGPMELELPSAHALHLFRIVQEAVSNAIRHADASTVRVEVLAAADGVRVTVLDDGTFRPPPDGHRGLGVEGMRSRAAELRGSFAVEPGNDHVGTRVTVALPRQRARK